MQRLSTVLCAAAFAAVCGASRAADDATTTLTAARLTQPPKLDGVLDDDCWRTAAWQSGFRRLADLTKPAAQDTRFALLCDEQFLYLAAEMTEPTPRSLVAKGKRRDARIYRDDCIQVFIDPVRNDSDYFCFSCNSLGTLRDNKKLTPAWNSDARVAAHVAEASWRLELAVPLSDLEMTPAAVGKPWGVNVARVRRAGGTTQLSTFAPVQGAFHQPEHFASLEAPAELLSPYLWQLSELADKKVTLVDGQTVLRAQVQVRNLTGRFRFILIQAGVHGEGGEARGEAERAGLDHSDIRFVDFETPTAGLEEGMAVVALHDALAPERLLAKRQFAVDLAYSPLSLELTVPWYKNAIFATQQVDAVELIVRSDLAADALAGLAVAAEIRAADDVVAGPVRVETAAAEVKAAIPAADLPVGDYRVHVALVDKAGRAVHKAKTRLRKLAPLQGEVRFDRNLACLVDGKPFFGCGWFAGTHEMLEGLAGEGYTLVGAYLPTCTRLTDEEVKAYLDKAHEVGLKVICRPQTSLKMLHSARNLLTEEEAAGMRALVRKWRDHPAVIGWYMCDEPEGAPQPLERRLQEYRIVDEEDPYHPAIVLNNTEPGIHKYQCSGDLLMPDVYPGFLRGGGAARMARPTGAMIACREATGGRKPVWITPQGQVQVRDGARGPTFRELRNQAWQGAAHDATSFFWYTVRFRTNLIASKIGPPHIHNEMKAVMDAVRSKSVPGVARAGVPDDRLSLGVKRVGGHLYVIAASLVFEDVEVAFEVADLGERALLVLSENRRIQPHDGRFSDRFEPHEAHVYTTDLSLTHLPTVAEIESEIEKEARARNKPGNLAYQGAGAEAFAEPDSGRALFLNDGSTVGVCWPWSRDYAAHPLPNWVEIRFPKPETVGRIVLYSLRRADRPPSFRDGEVQVMRDGAWTTIAKIAGNKAEPATIVFEPLVADRVRLLITRAASRRIALQEVEIYAK